MKVGLAKLHKALRLLARPSFVWAALRHGVAATVEHIPVIRRTAAATLIDIGANKGQFSLAFRAMRPRARIVAFEPLPDAARLYRRLFRADGGMELHPFALSDREHEADFHVTNRRDSSSLLKPGAAQDEAFGVKDAATLRVPVRRLDSCLAVDKLNHPILLKIDVQGAELDVLRGCDWLGQVDFIYVELSYIELYEGQPLHAEVANYLATRGFIAEGVFNEVATDKYGPIQADFLFKRT